MKFIKKTIQKILNKDNPIKITKLDEFIDNSNLVVGSDTIYDGVSLIIRVETYKNKTFLKIGNDSVVSGNFVFENDEGTIQIGERTFIGGGSFITTNEINIGDDVLISWGCTFMDNNAHSLKWSERKNDVLDWKKGIKENKLGYFKDWKNVKNSPIIIKDKVWIGFDVTILKGVTIGEGAIIAACSVVTKNVPDWTVVAGNPAKIVREIPKNER